MSQGGEAENFPSTDSFDGLLKRCMASGGPSVMEMGEPQLQVDVQTQMLDDLLNIKKDEQAEIANPYVEIIEQPKQKELRFRYECEGRSAGSLPGQRSDLDRKTFPTIKIHNYHGPVKVVASLVTREDTPRPHPHGLVGKDCEYGICRIAASQTDRMQVSFPNLGIQCVKQKEVIPSLQRRQGMGIDPYNWFATSKINLNDKKCKAKSLEFEMNVVCISFQVFIPDQANPTDFCIALPPVTTHPIFDKKGATLHIARCDRNHGSVKGGDEIYILCDKVQRDDISVIFYNEALQWEAKAEFGSNDIHRQVAIVCRTPPYQTLKIDKPVRVQFLLRRPSDLEQSDPVDFTYTPFDDDIAQIGAKRKRKAGNFKDYFKGPVDANVKVESLSENSSSCTYAARYGLTGSASNVAPIALSQAGMPQPVMDVKQKLRGKLLASNSNKSDGLDVRLPPNDQPSRPTKGRRSQKRAPPIAASFNVSTATNFGNMTSSRATTADVNSAIAGLLTINPEILNSMGLQTTASTIAAAQPTAVPTSLHNIDSAMNLFSSMQEGAMAGPSDGMSETDNAVQQILSQLPGPQGPSVEAVVNPSSVIELNSAGNWQIDGVEIADSQFAEEISNYAAQYMQTTTSGDLERVDLTHLQDAQMGGDILISEPNSPEMMVEGGVHDSVNIPFSNSIELGANPPMLNSDFNK
ncbi:nuclear factor NF-kappa-B p105 subunit-like [Amphiura filiformis]|uniref:nuclear factor NF-kappa-B p105 subunit-like n=1 Tax=Amphiura filiformis TaxID=82378 RepID=UPI003B22375E